MRPVLGNSSRPLHSEHYRATGGPTTPGNAPKWGVRSVSQASGDYHGVAVNVAIFLLRFKHIASGGGMVLTRHGEIFD